MKKTIAYWTILFIYIVISSFELAPWAAEQKVEQNKIKILRLDKELYNIVTTPPQKLTKRQVENNLQSIVALTQTINGNANTTNSVEILTKYYSHPQLNSLYKDVLKEFDNLQNYENELTQMYLLATKELNTTIAPRFSVHVSGFKENTIYINNTVSLSLDKYMGANYIGYKGYFKVYQLQQMQPKMIVRDMTKAWLMADYIKTETTNGDLLAEMIEHGKLLYALSVLVPQYSEQDLMGYSTAEYNWCIDNQKKIWTSILKQNQLYTTDRHVIHSYFDDVPNNKMMLPNSSENIGSWIGLQIVKQYAKEHKQALRTLIDVDSRTMLRESKYKL